MKSEIASKQGSGLPIAQTQGPNIEEETRYERYKEARNELDVSHKNNLISHNSIAIVDEANIEE